MKVLVPAPVGEGHQLLDPVPVTVNSTASVSHCRSDRGYCYFYFLEMKLELVDIQQFASVSCPWAAELRYERCSVWPHSLLHCGLAAPSTTARTSFLAMHPAASNWMLLLGVCAYPPTSALQIPVMRMLELAHTELSSERVLLSAICYTGSSPVWCRDHPRRGTASPSGSRPQGEAVPTEPLGVMTAVNICWMPLSGSVTSVTFAVNYVQFFPSSTGIIMFLFIFLMRKITLIFYVLNQLGISGVNPN